VVQWYGYCAYGPSRGRRGLPWRLPPGVQSRVRLLLDEARVVVDDIKVRGVGKTADEPGQSVFDELDQLRVRAVEAESAATRHSVYFDKIGRVDDTPVFELGKLAVGDAVDGPAVVIDDTQTIVVVPGARAVLTSRHVVITL